MELNLRKLRLNHACHWRNTLIISGATLPPWVSAYASQLTALDCSGCSGEALSFLSALHYPRLCTLRAMSFTEHFLAHAPALERVHSNFKKLLCAREADIAPQVDFCRCPHDAL